MATTRSTTALPLTTTVVVSALAANVNPQRRRWQRPLRAPHPTCQRGTGARDW